MNKKALVKNGHKHNTATFYISGETVPLNFNDLALHLVLTANDNRHRKGYSKHSMFTFVKEIINLGYRFKQVRTKKDFRKLEKELNKIYKKYYPNRRRFVNLRTLCELPEKVSGRVNYPNQRTLLNVNTVEPKFCPHCDCTEFVYHADRRMYQCKQCGNKVNQVTGDK